MPGSVGAGKNWIKNRLAAATDVCRVLDLGPGCGTYSKLFRKLYPDAEWIAIEAWGPYVREFDLRSHYNRVIVGDARYIAYEPLGYFDLCFCGDMLERMPEADARILIDQLLNRCRLLFASIPIGHFPQGEFVGNEFEARIVDNYTEERIRSLYPEIADGTIARSGRWTIGAFALTRNPHIAYRISKMHGTA